MAHHDQITELKPPGEPSPAPKAEETSARRDPKVGDILRAAREEQGISQRDVADRLHIRFVYIQALEASEYQKLPGTTYALGFLRTYAQHLDLDIEEMIRRYKEEATGSERKPQLVFPTPVPESRVPGAALVISALVLVAGAYGLWFSLGGDDQVAERTPALPERLQEMVEDSPGPHSLDGEETPGEPIAVAVGTPPATELATAAAESESLAVPQTAGEAEPLPASEPEVADAPPATLSTEVAEAGPQSSEPEPAAPSAEPVASEPALAEPAPAPVAEPAVLAEPAPADPVSPTVAPDSEPSLETSLAAAPPLVEPEQESVTSGTAPAPAETPAASEPAATATPVTTTAAIPAAPSTPGQSEVFGPPKPRTYGASNFDARIIVKATQDSWVQVRDAQDELLLTRLMRAGDSYRVPNQPGLTLLTGNAGGLDVEVDGASIGALGPVGKVRRDIALEPDRLLGTAPPSQ